MLQHVSEISSVLGKMISSRLPSKGCLHYHSNLNVERSCQIVRAEQIIRHTKIFTGHLSLLFSTYTQPWTKVNPNKLPRTSNQCDAPKNGYLERTRRKPRSLGAGVMNTRSYPALRQLRTEEKAIDSRRYVCGILHRESSEMRGREASACQ